MLVLTHAGYEKLKRIEGLVRNVEVIEGCQQGGGVKCPSKATKAPGSLRRVQRVKGRVSKNAGSCEADAWWRGNNLRLQWVSNLQASDTSHQMVS